MICNSRHDSLIAQHIQVAMIYKEMLGLDEAMAYLEREHIPRNIAERILQTEQARPNSSTAASGTSATSAPPTCRRKNRVHDAIVEAALKFERTHGRELALALLKVEGVSEAVALRILAQGPRQVRARPAAHQAPDR